MEGEEEETHQRSEKEVNDGRPLRVHRGIRQRPATTAPAIPAIHHGSQSSLLLVIRRHTAREVSSAAGAYNHQIVMVSSGQKGTTRERDSCQWR